MKIPKFTAESSLYMSGGHYHSMIGKASERRESVLPQMRYLGCRRVSPYYLACGVEDEGTRSSHWVIVRG